jgi:hypothetical protein
MSDRYYIFSDARATQERERLETLQVIFDLATQKYLEQIGVNLGWTCLV